MKKESEYLSFNSYKIKKIDFNLNEDLYVKLSNIHYDFNFEKTIEDRKLKLTLTTMLFDNKDEKIQSFKLIVSIVGYFELGEDLDESTQKEIIENNAVAILYPYLRMIISNVTSNLGISPIILPVINVANYLKKKYN